MSSKKQSSSVSDTITNLLEIDDFFLIPGAGKSGTSSVWKYLTSHPEISGCSRKEPCFFTSREIPKHHDLFQLLTTGEHNYERGLEWYRQLFPSAQEEASVMGEASTLYFIAPDAPKLIHKHIPDARLIFVLRDPVKRLQSHFWHIKKTGKPSPDTFEQFVKSDHPLFRKHCLVSSYKQNLERFQKFFQKKQMKIILTRTLKNQPKRILRELYSFLGVQNEYIPPALGESFNTASTARFPTLQRIMCYNFRLPYFLKKRLPKTLRETLRTVKDSILQLNTKNIDYKKMAPALRKKLIDRFDEDIKYIENWLGKSLSGWRNPKG